MVHKSSLNYRLTQKLSLSALILFALLSTLLGACSALNPGANQAQQATPTPLPTPIIPAKPTYEVKRGQVVNQVNFSGRFVPVVEQDLFFRTNGRVKAILIKRGDDVKKGQVLAQLETGGPDQFDVRKAQIDLEIAKLNLELTKAQVSSKDNQYPLLVGIKQREVDLAQNEVDRLGDVAAAAQIIAPFDGSVTSIAMTEGSTAEPFKTVIVIADLKKLEISADLKAEQLPALAIGMKAAVSSALGTGKDAGGTVRSLPGGSGQQTDVRITLDQAPADAGYKIGDRVNLTIILEKKENALWLPPQAIRDFNGRKFVIIQDAGGQARVDVKLGIQSDERVEILDGLSEGQLIISQ